MNIDIGLIPQAPQKEFGLLGGLSLAYRFTCLGFEHLLCAIVLTLSQYLNQMPAKLGTKRFTQFTGRKFRHLLFITGQQVALIDPAEVAALDR